MIYVLGDSFSSGAELADYLMPSWPGHLDPKLNHAVYNAWCGSPIALKEGDDVENKHGPTIFNDEMHRLSWAGQLQEITQHTVFNGSTPKTGPSFWPYKLTQDLSQLASTNQTPSLVILQFTSIDREVVFETQSNNIHPRFINAGSLSNRGPDTDYFVNLKLLENPVANFYRFLATVQIAQAICRGYGVANVLLASTHDIVRSIMTPAGGVELLMSHPAIETAMSATGIDWFNLTCLESCAEYTQGELPGGHYNADTNRRFAEMIANKYLVNTL